jgi:tellurite methyltransferase
MPSSQLEWDAKHRLTAEAPSAEPAGIVRELLPLLPMGHALDLACGTGSNTLFLGARHLHVTAVDWSGTALEILETQARAAHIAVHHFQGLEPARRSSRAGIGLVQANLEETALPERSYDMILCIRYLQRSLFPQICRALRPGGVLLFETYTQAQLEFDGGPRHPAHLLEPGELRDAFPGLCVLFYRELRAGQGIASLAAQQRGRRNPVHNVS